MANKGLLVCSLHAYCTWNSARLFLPEGSEVFEAVVNQVRIDGQVRVTLTDQPGVPEYLVEADFVTWQGQFC